MSYKTKRILMLILGIRTTQFNCLALVMRKEAWSVWHSKIIRKAKEAGLKIE